MKKTISVLALASIFAAGTAFASAYRIPEQSVDSTAKAGADISSADHADAAYFNPANMSWLDNAWQVEGDLDYIHLSSINYADSRTSYFNGSSKEENFLAPTIFMVSPDFNNFRFGFSITEPYGLAKRWNDLYPSATAGKFELQVFDFNPTVSYKINKIFSVAGGIRLLYSTAEVASNASGLLSFESIMGGGGPVSGPSRFMSGDATGWGYNLAVSARPNDKSNISVTYRSEVDLDLSGNVTIAGYGGYGIPTINTTGKVTVVAPAVLAVSGAYTFDKLTVELTWDRTFWSEYKNLDFTYANPTANSLPGMGLVTKNWDDSNAYRLGLTYKATQVVTLMAGFAYDETPVPSDTLGFELPDSPAYLFSLGTRFKLTSQMDLGLAVLYDMKTSRSVNEGHIPAIDGKFTDASALLVSAGISYKF